MRDIEYKALILMKVKKMECYAKDFEPLEKHFYSSAMREGYYRAVAELKRYILELTKVEEETRKLEEKFNNNKG